MPLRARPDARRRIVIVEPPPPPPPAGVRAFPTAEGFGANALGGRGPAATTPAQRQLIRVTNLNDSGAGSLRAAVQATGPRFVVFDVAGTINLQTELIITNPYIYIAGQTAPRGGICITCVPTWKQNTLTLSTNDAIIRHIRVRCGFKGDQYPGATAGSAGQASRSVGHKGGAANSIWDHCSITWGTDININTNQDANNISVQWCLIAEPLHRAGHNQILHGRSYHHDFALPAHGRISDHHNLFAHSEARHPEIALGVQGVEAINNVIYHTLNVGTAVNTAGGGSPCNPQNSKARIRGCYYKRLGDPNVNREIKFTEEPCWGPEMMVFVDDNIGPNRPLGTEAWYLSVAAAGRPPSLGGGTASRLIITNGDETCTSGTTSFPLPQIPVVVDDPFDAYNEIVRVTNPTVGATKPMLDAADRRIIQRVIDNTTVGQPGAGHQLLDHPGMYAPGGPDYTDPLAGYPDLTVGGTAALWSVPANPMNVAANGYLNIENSLNALAGDAIP